MTDDNYDFDDDLEDDDEALENDYNHIETVESTALAVVIENDNTLTSIEQRLPHFRTLTAKSQPIEPYELEDHSGESYYSRPESKCDVCKSPFKKLAETAYLHYGKRPWRVVKFFERHYGVTLTHESIKRHMEIHCDFKNIQKPGLVTYGLTTPEVEMWLFREKQLAMIMVLAEIDYMKMLADQCGSDKDMRLRISNQIIKLQSEMNKLAKERDDETKTFKIGDFIAHIKIALEKLTDEESKKIMYESIMEFQKMLLGSTTVGSK